MFRLPRPHLPFVLFLAMGLLALLGASTRRGDAESPSPWRAWGGRVGPLAAEAGGPAFLAWGTRIHQVSEPGAPLALHERLALPEVVEGLAVGQGLLAASSRAPSGAAAAELRLWSLDAGARLIPVGQVVALPGKEVGAVAIGYARAIVLTERGVAVIRLKDPERPTLEVEVAVGAPAGARSWDGSIALAAGRAWLARPWGLETVDLSRLESELGTPALRRLDDVPTRDVVATTDHVFALRADGRLTVLAAADGRRLMEAQVADQPLAVAADGERLLVVDHSGRRLRWYGLAEGRPLWRGDQTLLPQGSNRGQLLLRDAAALLSLEGAGLLRSESPGAAVVALPLLPAPRQIWPERERIWVAAGTAGLWTLTGTADSPSLAINGLLLLAGQGGLHLANPDLPSAERVVEVQAVAARGATVFVLTARDGLVVLSRDGKEGLRIAAQLLGVATGPGAAGLLLDERRLVGLTAGGGIFTVDVTDADQPRLLGVTNDLGILDLAPLGAERLALVGMGALGRGRFGVAALPTAGAVLPPAVWLDLDAVFSRAAAADRTVVISGASEGIAMVDWDAVGGPHLSQRLPGALSGRVGMRGDLLQLTDAQGLAWILRLPGGGLRPLGRVSLPAPGLAGGVGRDVIDAGDALYLPRGQAGVLRLASARTAAATGPEDARMTSAFLPALEVGGTLRSQRCHQTDAWLLLLDDRLPVVAPTPGEVALRDGVYRLALGLRHRDLPAYLGRYGSQAELLAEDGQARPGQDGSKDAAPGRADLGLALALRLRETEALGRLGVLMTVAGPIDAQSQRLMDRQTSLLAAGGMPLVRLDMGEDGIRATMRSVDARVALRTTVGRGDWDGLAGELAAACW